MKQPQLVIGNVIGIYQRKLRGLGYEHPKKLQEGFPIKEIHTK
jgi:hypothetical protein